jgi:hypothetical protein
MNQRTTQYQIPSRRSGANSTSLTLWRFLVFKSLHDRDAAGDELRGLQNVTGEQGFNRLGVERL